MKAEGPAHQKYSIPLQRPFKAFDYVVKTMRCGRKKYPEMGVEFTRRNARSKKGLLELCLKKGFKQSFLTDSGKAQSSEMVRGELQSKKPTYCKNPFWQ